jgi:hypothetical protein
MSAATGIQTNRINLEVDEVRPVHEVCKRLTGKRPSPATIWRWVRKCCNGCRLEAVHIQGHWQTTTGEFARFICEKSIKAIESMVCDQSTERDSVTARRLKAAGLI